MPHLVDGQKGILFFSARFVTDGLDSLVDPLKIVKMIGRAWCFGAR